MMPNETKQHTMDQSEIQYSELHPLQQERGAFSHTYLQTPYTMVNSGIFW